MVKKTENGYRCSICGTLYVRDTYALSCEQAHDVIYVPFTSGELFRLIQFLFTKDEDLLDKQLMDKLMSYKQRNIYNIGENND